MSDKKESINSLNLSGLWTRPEGEREKQQREEGYHSRCTMENNLCAVGGEGEKRKRRKASPLPGYAESEGTGVGV